MTSKIDRDIERNTLIILSLHPANPDIPRLEEAIKSGRISVDDVIAFAETVGPDWENTLLKAAAEIEVIPEEAIKTALFVTRSDSLINYEEGDGFPGNKVAELISGIFKETYSVQDLEYRVTQGSISHGDIIHYANTCENDDHVALLYKIAEQFSFIPDNLLADAGIKKPERSRLWHDMMDDSLDLESKYFGSDSDVYPEDISHLSLQEALENGDLVEQVRMMTQEQLLKEFEVGTFIKTKEDPAITQQLVDAGLIREPYLENVFGIELPETQETTTPPTVLDSSSKVEHVAPTPRKNALGG